ncbi:AMP-binding protein [Nocardioides sp. CBS4Y-1]|uniref:AMP-binding protein n=1 Tax=Nocardioides acrostichi TaxID=2784339 RepID=A0A930UX77_9ACTN|nr:AMP-binding protein [Nocardioides acrostichi]
MSALFEASFEARRQEPLLRLEGAEWTYGDVDDLATRIAVVLAEQGVQPGDRVAVKVPKVPETVALYLAVLRLGGVYLPLNSAYTGGELTYFLDDARPRVMVADLGGESEVEATGVATTTLTLGADAAGTLLEHAARVDDAARPPRVEIGPDDAAAILYTSGTTGRSKGAVLTHRGLASNCEALLSTWRFTADDVLVHALPLFHVHGLFVALNMTMSAGASLHFLPGFDTDRIIDLLPSSTVLMGVPTFYTRLLDHPGLTREQCVPMRLFVSGSAPLTTETHEAWRDRTGHAILERYGMTETNMITSNPYDGERRAGTVGQPLPGVQVRVTDRETGAPLAAGEIGSIEVRGPNVFREYWNKPEKTAEELAADGWFTTGDVGLFDADGYLAIVGRDKDLVISGGYNVYPKEVEALLDEHDSVLESAVIGVPHPDLGEAVVAVVVPSSGSGLDTDDLLASLTDRLARFKQPRAVEAVEELPRNVMGKVQKAELRASFAHLFTPTTSPAPQSAQKEGDR